MLHGDSNSNVYVNHFNHHLRRSGRDGHCAVVLNGSIFVIGGTDDPYCCQSDVWRSDDGGKTWIEVRNTSEWPERWQHACCVHKDHIYVAGGWGGKSYYANDDILIQSSRWQEIILMTYGAPLMERLGLKPVKIVHGNQECFIRVSVSTMPFILLAVTMVGYN